MDQCSGSCLLYFETKTRQKWNSNKFKHINLAVINSLCLCRVRKPLSDIPPGLSFATVEGEERPNPSSTSWFNDEEAEIVVEIVSNLYHNWPETWGDRDLSHVAVTAHYRDQVCRHDCSLPWSGDCSSPWSRDCSLPWSGMGSYCWFNFACTG